MKENKYRFEHAVVLSTGCMVLGGIIVGIARYLAKHNPPIWLILVAVFIFLTIVVYLILDDED